MLQTLKNLAGGLIFDGWLFHSIIFPHSSSHDVPWCSIPSISKVVDSVALALTIAFFTSTVRGCPAETALRLWVSYIYCVTFRQHVQLSTYNPARPPRPISVVTTMGVFSCLVNLVSEPVDATLSLWCETRHLEFLIPKCYFRMILALFCHRSHFPLCVLAMWGNLSRQEVVLHYLFSCLIPMPPFFALKV